MINLTSHDNLVNDVDLSNVTIIKDHFSIKNFKKNAPAQAEYDLSTILIIEDYFSIAYGNQTINLKPKLVGLESDSLSPFHEFYEPTVITKPITFSSVILSQLSKPRINSTEDELATSSQITRSNTATVNQALALDVKAKDDNRPKATLPIPIPTKRTTGRVTSDLHTNLSVSFYTPSCKVHNNNNLLLDSPGLDLNPIHTTKFTPTRARAAKPVLFNHIRESVTYSCAAQDVTPDNTPKLTKISAVGRMLSLSI